MKLLTMQFPLLLLFPLRYGQDKISKTFIDFLLPHRNRILLQSICTPVVTMLRAGRLGFISR